MSFNKNIIDDNNIENLFKKVCQSRNITVDNLTFEEFLSILSTVIEEYLEYKISSELNEKIENHENLYRHEFSEYYD